jgi:hypothetical protein
MGCRLQKQRLSAYKRASTNTRQQDDEMNANDDDAVSCYVVDATPSFGPLKILIKCRTGGTAKKKVEVLGLFQKLLLQSDCIVEQACLYLTIMVLRQCPNLYPERLQCCFQRLFHCYLTAVHDGSTTTYDCFVETNHCQRAEIQHWWMTNEIFRPRDQSNMHTSSQITSQTFFIQSKMAELRALSRKKAKDPKFRSAE